MNEEGTPSEEIIKVPNLLEPEVIAENKSQLPEAPNTAENIRTAIQKKVDQGINMSDKSVYPRIFKEIAEIENCSYQNVLKIGKLYLKKSNGDISKTSVQDGSVVNVKTVKPESRPPPKEKPQQTEPSTLGRIIPTNLSKEQLDTMLQFESDMIELSFSNISMFLKSLGVPAPQQNKIKKMCHTIAIFNQKMDLAGKPEQKIDIGEKLLPLMIKIGVVGMFFQPIANKWFVGKGNKDEIKKVSKSMRE